MRSREREAENQQFSGLHYCIVVLEQIEVHWTDISIPATKNRSVTGLYLWMILPLSHPSDQTLGWIQMRVGKDTVISHPRIFGSNGALARLEVVF